jgi:Na+/melibiose symporter-like transporter
VLNGAGDAVQGVSPDVAQTLKILFFSVQSVGLVAGILVFVFYPISRAKSEETRRMLDQRKATCGDAALNVEK